MLTAMLRREASQVTSQLRVCCQDSIRKWCLDIAQSCVCCVQKNSYKRSLPNCQRANPSGDPQVPLRNTLSYLSSRSGQHPSVKKILREPEVGLPAAAAPVDPLRLIRRTLVPQKNNAWPTIQVRHPFSKESRHGRKR